MKVIFRIDDSKEMEQAVTGLIELLKTKGGFHGVRTDGGLMIKGKRGWKKVRPREPWSSPTNNSIWQAMLDKLYMEHYVFRWWAYGGMYSLYYNKPDRYWSLSYEGDQFSMHKLDYNGAIGAHLLNVMLTLGGEPHLHIEESPGLAWTDVDGTEEGLRRLKRQKKQEQRLTAQQRVQKRALAALQQVTEQLQAQQNPLLVRLTEELMREGRGPKDAFNQTKGYLDRAEKEAEQLNQMVTAQQNPLLVRLAEILIEEGRSRKGAFAQVEIQLNRAENEARKIERTARHLERMAIEQAAAQSRREERARQHAIHQAQDKANHLAWLAQDKERHAAA